MVLRITNEKSKETLGQEVSVKEISRFRTYELKGQFRIFTIVAENVSFVRGRIRNSELSDFRISSRDKTFDDKGKVDRR